MSIATMDLRPEKPEGVEVARGGEITISISIDSLPHYFCIVPADAKNQHRLRLMLDYLIAEKERSRK